MVIAFFLAFLALASLLLFLSSARFGRLPRGERKRRVLLSPHYRNGRFCNDTPTRISTLSGGLLANFWCWVSGRDRSERQVPKLGEVPVVRTDLHNLPPDGDLYIWFGHSSFLLRLSGEVFLFDPVFVSGSPVPFLNRMFPGTDIYKPEDMPSTIDYLVISHDHWDHLDYDTVVAIRSHVRLVVCPLGVGESFERWGYAKDRVVELDWNESHGVFTCLPTRHFSGRLFQGQTQGASWLVRSAERMVFFSGDGGFDGRFVKFGKDYPGIDLAIMENGQYDNRWGHIHTLPGQLGAEVAALAPKRFVTVHHSKFPLANHAWDEPRVNERVAAEQSGVPLLVCRIGEVVFL